MGCKGSTAERELFNEDVEIKRFLTGIHISKGAEGLEGNVQIALATTRKKKYERVGAQASAPQASAEEDRGTLEST